MARARLAGAWGVGAIFLLTIGVLAALQFGMTVWAAALAGMLGAVGAGQVWLMKRALDAAAEQHKQIQKQLEETRASLDRLTTMGQSMLESLPGCAALVWDGRIEFSNAAAMRAGIARGNSAFQMPVWFRNLVETPDIVGMKRDAVRLAVDGHEKQFAPTARATLDRQGATRGAFISLQEISDPRSAAAKVVSSFSHDLRTPLTSIQMTIHLLLENAAQFSPQQVEFLNAARDDAFRLQALIEEMVAVARGQA